MSAVSPLYSQRGDEGEFEVANLNSPNPSRHGGFATLNERGENGTARSVRLAGPSLTP
jgi:hypothetical protein